MSLLFSIPSMLPSHLATEMTIALRMVVETVNAGIFGTEILGGLGSLFSAFFYIGIQQNLSDRAPSCDNRRPDWTKYYSPRSTRDGLKPALA
jgi:hypothetical protein